ncbi:hypothetical protein EON65_50045 [archaeon]|nr:MAG: hypothetical protein EON65_50045 [archaeon]
MSDTDDLFDTKSVDEKDEGVAGSGKVVEKRDDDEDSDVFGSDIEESDGKRPTTADSPAGNFEDSDDDGDVPENSGPKEKRDDDEEEEGSDSEGNKESDEDNEEEERGSSKKRKPKKDRKRKLKGKGKASKKRYNWICFVLYGDGQIECLCYTLLCYMSIMCMR